MTTIQNFQQRFRFVNSDGTLTPEASRMLRDWFARIGGPDSINLTEVLALLTAIQVEILAIQSEATALGLEVDDLGIEVDNIGFRVDGIESAPLPADNSAVISSLESHIYQMPQQQIVEAVEFLQTEVRSLAEKLAVALRKIEDLEQGTML